MQPTPVLFVSHGHPRHRPGGAEVYALELYSAFRRSAEFNPSMLIRAGPEHFPRPADGPPARLQADEEGIWFAVCANHEYDWFTHTSLARDLSEYWLPLLLRRLRPRVVHVQHTYAIGYDILPVVRRVLPTAAVVYTLHEYLPICHHRGIMVKTGDRGACPAASPAACHDCFPDIAPVAFAAREWSIKSSLSAVDAFVCPSRFLLERFADWGIARDRLVYEEYGRLPRPAAPDPPPGRPRTRFGFFGQLNPFKGIDTLLRGVQLLAGSGAVDGLEVRVYGANLGLQPPRFRELFRRLLAGCGSAVTFAGPYDQDQVADRMAEVDWVVVPSTWYENSPLVIQEAFQHGRPVICSDLGAMREKVRDGVDGLHFRAGDPAALAAAMHTAATSPGLWNRLRAGIRPVHLMSDHVERLTRLYRELLARR